MRIQLDSIDNKKIATAIADADFGTTEITVTIDDIDFDVTFYKEVIYDIEEYTNGKIPTCANVSVFKIEVSGSAFISVGVNYQEIEKYTEKILLH